MADQHLVNGKQISWGSIKLKVEGEPYYGVKSVAYGDSLEVQKTYGMGRHHGPRGQSAGKYSADNLVLSMETETVQLLREQLAALSPTGNSVGAAIVQIVVQYLEMDQAPVTVELEDCRFLKSTVSHAESPDALTEDVEFSVMRIRRNGYVLWDDRRG